MARTGESGVDLERKVSFLRRPQGFPEATERVDVVETHMSWVFLTDRHAYKLKKPLRFELVNLVSVEARRRNCEEEVRLNRRLAPDVYLGVVPLTVDEAGRLAFSGSGEVVDWLVKMERLPAEHMLDRAIDAGALDPIAIEKLGETLGAFYRRLPSLRVGASEYRGRFLAAIEESARELESLSPIPRARIRAASSRLDRILRERGFEVDERVLKGRIVEGHGDLRPEHVCLLEKPVVIDCLEFSPALRALDPVDELSFLSLECQRLGGPSFVEPRLFSAYARETGDAPPPGLVRLYKMARSFARAQTAIWHLREPKLDDPVKWVARAERYLEMAEEISRSWD